MGGTLGGALKKAKTGVATIGVGSNGRIQVSSLSGTNAKFKEQAGNSADSAISTIERIAESLGGSLVKGAGAVSIGIRNGSYRVDTTGGGATKKKKGAIDFGEDAEAAIKFATLDLIKDGVIAGIRASTQRILQAAKDLDSGIEKAIRFEGVFARLKAFKDPVGAAIDTLNKEFTSLKRLFEDASASAEEFAQLEELYGLERAKAIKDATESTTNALKSLIDDLKIGDNGLSLRDRLANAQAAFNPLAAQIDAGKVVDYDAFATAARNLIDIQRAISGSQEDYFSVFNNVLRLSEKAIGDQSNVTSIGRDFASPFSSPTTPSNDNTPVVDAISSMTNAVVGQLMAVNQNLGSLILGGAVGSVIYENSGGRFNF